MNAWQVTAIIQLLEQRQARVLACAPTNVALHHLAASIASEAPHLVQHAVMVVDEQRLMQVPAPHTCNAEWACLCEDRLVHSHCVRLPPCCVWWQAGHLSEDGRVTSMLLSTRLGLNEEDEKEGEEKRGRGRRVDMDKAVEAITQASGGW